MKRNQNKLDSQKKFTRLYVRSALKSVFMFPLVFLLAGRLDYWQGWVFCLSIIFLTIVLWHFFKDNLDLAQERIKPGPGTKKWDIGFYAVFITFFTGLFVISILDAARFHWSPVLPFWIYIIGYVLYVLSNAMIIWPMKVNRYFSSVVRIQKDRGQTVIQDGPYRLVRHPGYLGGLFLCLSCPLILGSLYGLIPGGILVMGILARTHLEDKTLQKELEGYREFASKVRYKIFPGLW
jgi:protein-S-isoprenylcysteine O-methyltransferase Ste14